jgi:ParB/RepB/Spo0J family partition protein
MTTAQTLPLAQLAPAPWNPRGAIDEHSLAELVESIRVQGVLTPILVRPVNGHHEIIAGHRRVQAAALAGLELVPVRIGTFTDEEAREVAIVENLQRADIRPLDEARAYEAMLPVDDVLLGARAIAARIGKPVDYVWDRLQLLQLYVQPSVKSDERIYTVKTWARADGQDGSTVCDRAVLGVVVVGPGYGEAFSVCIHKGCETHWPTASPDAATRVDDDDAPGREQRDAERRKAAARQAKEERAREAWKAEVSDAMQAFAAHLSTMPFSADVVRQVVPDYRLEAIAKGYGVKLTSESAVAVLVLSAVNPYSREQFDRTTKPWKFTWKPKPKAKAGDEAKPAKKAAKGKTR